VVADIEGVDTGTQKRFMFITHLEMKQTDSELKDEVMLLLWSIVLVRGPVYLLPPGCYFDSGEIFLLFCRRGLETC
jgi:hypothetical protein